MDRPEILGTQLGDYLWIPTQYVDNPAPTLGSSVLGVTIVAHVNWYPRPTDENPDAGIGDYAAYMGVCPGLLSGLHAAEYVARRGTKVSEDLAEYLFRQEIEERFPAQRINWRR